MYLPGISLQCEVEFLDLVHFGEGVMAAFTSFVIQPREKLHNFRQQQEPRLTDTLDAAKSTASVSHGGPGKHP